MPKPTGPAAATGLPAPSRRRLLAGLAALPALGLASVAAADRRPIGTHRDPTFAAIERHASAWEALEATADLGAHQSPTWHAVNEAEKAAWLAVTGTCPTTLAGLATLAEYLDATSAVDHLILDDGLAQVFGTLATGLRALADRQVA